MMKTRWRAAILGTAAVMVMWTAAAGAAAQDPKQVVETTTAQVLQALEQAGDTDQREVHGLIEQMVLPHFDFRKMSQWVLGKNWKQASPEDRERFVAEFQKLLVRTYSSALMEYTGQKITYLPTQAEPDGKIATVKTQVNQPDGATIPIDYRLHSSDGDWKVFDVAVAGVSLVANYRTSFNEQISAKGFDGLIEDLAARNR